jgi:hypothetical protein
MHHPSSYKYLSQLPLFFFLLQEFGFPYAPSSFSYTHLLFSLQLKLPLLFAFQPPLLTKTSSSASSFHSGDQLSSGNNLDASPKHGGEVQSTKTHLGVEAQNLGEAPVGEEI